MEQNHKSKNEQVKAMVQYLNDQFVFVRSISKNLYENMDIDSIQLNEFLIVVINESEKLIKIVNQVSCYEVTT